MKKHTTLVIAFVITISTFGQQIKDIKHLTHRNSEKQTHTPFLEKRNKVAQNHAKLNLLLFRSSTLPGEKLDSVSETNGNSAIVFSYNENGWLTETKEYDYDTIAAIRYLSFKNVLTYDNSGNNLTSIEFSRDNSSQPLALSYRKSYTYNGNNKMLSEEQISHDMTDSYKYKYTYEYDGAGNLTTKYSSVADTNQSKEVFVYNGNNLPIIDEHYNWSQGAYQLGNSDTTKYDASNNDTLIVSNYSKTKKNIRRKQ